MRPIDGDRLMMHLTDWWYSSFGQAETDESKAIKTVMDKIEQTLGEFALEKQEADRWIPVKEREPTETGLYLVTETTVVERKWTTRIRVARCDVTELKDGRIDVCWRGYGGNVLAWMPLPDPYTEEEG